MRWQVRTGIRKCGITGSFMRRFGAAAPVNPVVTIENMDLTPPRLATRLMWGCVHTRMCLDPPGLGSRSVLEAGTRRIEYHVAERVPLRTDGLQIRRAVDVYWRQRNRPRFCRRRACHQPC